MRELVITGGVPLDGEMTVSGSKNAALPMLAAAAVFSGPVCIRNCPALTDVDAALEILAHLGAVTRREGSTVHIDPGPICRWQIPGELTARMRGSVLFAGALMARFGVCELNQPGGCRLGSRPVDFHRDGLLALGAEESDGDCRVLCGPLTGGEVILPYPSVGATENLILAAVGALGPSCIRNAAREPEIVCLCRMLRRGGCAITGDGTDVVYIRGVMPDSAQAEVIPDRMEAATFACAIASAGGRGVLHGAHWPHFEPVLQVLEQAGCQVRRQEKGVEIWAQSLKSPGSIVTGPYPAFPTDAQATVMAALLRAGGTTRITETVFDRRMGHVPGLVRLGADITCRANTAELRGVEALRGTAVEATDLRGGAAMAVAALAARGQTKISNTHHLMRGYENFAGKLRALGARVQTV